MACMVVAGCLGSPEPTTEFLTLPRALAPGLESEAAGVSVGLGPFSVAPHLERRSLAYRVDERRVEFADSAQWVAPLDDMVGQHMAERMARELGVGRVSEFPWPQSRAPEVQVTLHLEEFAVGPGQSVTIAARWSLREPQTGRGLGGGLWERTLPVDGYSATQQVSALSTTLDALSDFLAEQVRAQSSR